MPSVGSLLSLSCVHETLDFPSAFTIHAPLILTTWESLVVVVVSLVVAVVFPDVAFIDIWESA